MIKLLITKTFVLAKAKIGLKTQILDGIIGIQIYRLLGLNQLKRINNIIKKKFHIGNYYYKHFKNLKNIILQPNKLPYCKNIYWVFGIVVKKK